MYKIVEISGGDLISAHEYLLGSKLGKMVSLLFISYFIIAPTAVLRSYIEVVQVWMFPNLNTFWFALPFLLLVVYIIYGGFRTVTGIAFFGTVLPAYLIFTFGYTVPFAHYENLLPVLDHSVTELLQATRDMSLTYLGYESFLLYYPYLKEPEKSKKWAHLAIFSTTIVYTFLTIITFSYFSEGQLEQVVWATLTMWKIVEMPFVERFEYIGITNWNLIILPNICIALWCASRILKRTIRLSQKKGVFIVSALCLMMVSYFKTRGQIDMLNDLIGRLGFYINFLYVPFLFVAILIVKKVKKK